MIGYDFHPEAEIDLNEIWDHIAYDSVSAADRVVADVHSAIENLVLFPVLDTVGRILRTGLCGSFTCEIT